MSHGTTFWYQYDQTSPGDYIFACLEEWPSYRDRLDAGDCEGPSMSNELREPDISSMSEQQLVEFLHNKGCPRICRECYNAPLSGYVLCIQCMYGQSARADHIYVLAKRRLERLRGQL